MISSILDNDFYKFTMMHAVLEQYPQADATYRFINRSPEDKFSGHFVEKLKGRIEELGRLRLTDEEFAWFDSLELLPKSYLEKLKSFQLDPSQVICSLDMDGQLGIEIKGKWWETILFEVPLLALISETYFEEVPVNIEEYKARTHEKGLMLSEAGCDFLEFGTRRRRSFEVQDAAIKTFTNLGPSSTYLGTSNVLLSKKYNTTPLGTMAHEWIMAHGGLFGVPGANTRALEAWLKIYSGDFSIALTDTYSTKTFFEEFTPELAQKFSGIRQDSGDPLKFVDQALAFYQNSGIDPKDKAFVFSDSLNCEKAVEIQKYAKERFPVMFGIGTHFTNDIPGERALNIVIKLAQIDGTDVYKTTDAPSKQCFVD